ncbi:MAG: N-acetyltransferase [Eubacteriaceae bacterium]|nr:N-acetyltransferase [Eubacteriaceae bacterium]
MLRTARKKDLIWILEIYNYYILNSTAVYHYNLKDMDYMEKWYDDKIKKGYPLLIWEENGEVAAFGTYGDFRPYEGYKHTLEHSVYVDGKFHGRGIGEALLTRLLADAKEKKFKTMLAYIDSGNAPSIKLHEKLGFSHCGIIKSAGYKFNRYLDLTIMQFLFTD